MDNWLQNKSSPKPKSRVIKEKEKEKEKENIKLEEVDDGKSKFVVCPVCSESIPKSTINSHLDACINGTNNTNDNTNNNDNNGNDIDNTTTINNIAKPNEFTRCPSCNGNILNTTFESHERLCTKEKEKDGNKRKRDNDQQINSNNNNSNNNNKKSKWAPLAERSRPTELEGVIGQDKLIGDDTILNSLITKDSVPSIILWGPPGCGKTTIARIISRHTKTHFVSLSAVTSGVADVKKAVSDAQSLSKLTRQRTTLFLDEIHRFNKLQQDIFLPYVENGTITLIGATTENPSFEVNSALLSRCKVFVLQKLQPEHIKQILTNSIQKFNEESKNNNNNQNKLIVEEEVLDILSSSADGDARTALNLLDLAMESRKGEGENIHITTKNINGAMQKTHLLYDKKSDQHYNVISALHKSMRGGDVDAALYWLGRMLEGGEDPLYVARRLIRFSSEDVGLADPSALVQAVAAFQASHMIGMPECNVVLAQCVAYLARAPKSIAVYKAYNAVRDCISNEPTPPVPLHISNAPTFLMKELGYSKGYKYTPEYDNPDEAKQDYLPEALLGRKFFHFDEKFKK